MIGNCFYYQTRPAEVHLFVVVAPDQEEPDSFICVNIATKRGGSDATCELFRGEHERLTAPVSIVLYGFARSFPRALISRLMGEQRLPRMSAAVLSRIQQSALLDNSRMRKKYQRAVREYLNSPLAG